MQKIEMVRGTSEPIHIALTDDDGNAYTLKEGERLLLGVMGAHGGGAVLIRKAAAADDGGYVWRLKPADTVNITAGDYLYDVNLETGEDFLSVINQNPFVLRDNSTKKGDTET